MRNSNVLEVFVKPQSMKIPIQWGEHSPYLALVDCAYLAVNRRPWAFDECECTILPQVRTWPFKS